MSNLDEIKKIFFKPMVMGKKQATKQLSSADAKEYESEIYPHAIEKIGILLPVIDMIPNFLPPTTEIPSELLAKLSQEEIKRLEELDEIIAGINDR